MSRSLVELADWLETWTKSNGRKHRKWAKIPVAAVREACEQLRAGNDTSWSEAGAKAREWETYGNYLRGLVQRMVPHVEAALAFAKRGTAVKVLPGSTAAVRDAFRLRMEDMAKDAEKLLTEARKAMVEA